MITQKQTAEQAFYNVINKIRHNRTVIENIKEGMMKHGILRGETQKIINGDIKFEKIEKSTIILLLSETYKFTGNSSINPENFFTEKDKIEALNKDIIKKIKMGFYPIIFDNVDKINDGFVTTVYANYLASLYNNNILQYNNNVSSNYKIVNRGDRIFKVANIDTQMISDMTKSIMSGNKPSTIFLNVLEGSGNVYYDEHNRQLQIDESQIDIIDGLHQIGAFSRYAEIRQNNRLKVEVVIKNYNATQAKQFIKQLKLEKGGVR